MQSSAGRSTSSRSIPKHTILSLIAFSLATACSLARGGETRDEPRWRPLPLVADGKVAEGWRQVGWGGFVVDDGALRTECDPKGLGLLVYEKEKFGNCQIRVVFKSKDATSNAGVHVRIADGIREQFDRPGVPIAREADGTVSPEAARARMESAEREEGPWFAVHRGYEVQILDESDPLHRTGAIYSFSASSATSSKAPDAWRTMLITLAGEEIFVDLDGRRITSFDSRSRDVPEARAWFDPKREPKRPEAGYIGLQNHFPGDVVWFKEVSVRKLADAASAVASPEDNRADRGLVDFGAPPLFSFLGWEKRPRIEDGAVRIQAPDSKGGFGYNVQLDLSGFSDRTPAVTLTVGPAHRTKSLKLLLKDSDGTSHEYAFAFEGIAAGGTSTLWAVDGASLSEPGAVGDVGKEPGFDLARVAQVIFVGDWSEAPVDVSVRRLELVEPTPAILAARERMRERLAREAEERRRAEEAKAKRRREILAGAPHPPDGPDVRHVGAIAPDILALRIQEKEFVPVPQVPYEPKDGDLVRREGKEEDKVLVLEAGQIRESPLEVSVYRKDGGRESKLGHLAVNAGCLKPEDRVTGQDLTAETVDAPEAYRVVGLDDPDWNEPVAPETVWWKRKPDAFRSMAFEVQVFLKLPRPLAEGKRYRLEFPGVNFRQASIEYLHAPSSTRSVAVHVSAIGFRPDDPFKRAFLSAWLGTGGAHRYARGLRFHLLDDSTSQPVFEGPVRPLKGADEAEAFKEGRNYSKTDVLGMDFGAFVVPGRYRVFVEGIGCSYPFEIADDVWTRAFRLSMKGLLNERSGIELGPPFTDYLRPRNMHPADGAQVFASGGSEVEGGNQDGIFRMLARRRTSRLMPNAWGGHMDAGDWDRNSQHPAAMWLLVDLYELFPERIGKVRLALPPAEAENEIPDILDEVLWNLDLYRRLQTAEGGVGGGIESTSHPRPGEASWQESLLVSAYAPDPRSSFIYAATAAKLARVLDPIDEALSATYAASTRKAWEWACANQQEFLGRLGGKGRSGMAEELRDRRNLAAFELWRLTGDRVFHEAFKATTRLSEPNGEVARQSKAATSYARLPDGQGDAALRDAARRWLLAAADASLAFADGNAFGLSVPIPTLPPMGFVGYFSTPETILGPILPHAWLLTRDPRYLAGSVRACQFAAGANPDNRALTTGLGPDPVRFPLHIDSWVTGQPAPAGITVYGISDPAESYSFDGWAHTWFLQKMVPSSRSWPAHESYWDIYVVPSTNEFTIHQTMIPTAFYWGFLAARP